MSISTITCPFCGASFKALTSHLIHTHHVTDMEEFKETYPNVSLLSLETLQKMGRRIDRVPAAVTSEQL